MAKGLHYRRKFLTWSFPIYFTAIVIRPADNSHYKNDLDYVMQPKYIFHAYVHSCVWIFIKMNRMLTHPLHAREMPVSNLWTALGKVVRKIQGETYHPTLNSTWASKRATTGAVATLHPLTRDRISPSCLLCRTTLMKSGLRAFTSSTYFFSFSLSSSVERKELDVTKQYQQDKM